MIAYKTKWLDALAVKAQSRKWHNKGLISASQLQKIQEKFRSSFYTPNIFIRIGLGIFCWILVSSVLGLFAIAIFSGSRAATGGTCLFISIGLLVILEMLIRDKNYYRAGIDDALLYMALSMAVTGISLLFSPLFEKYEVLYFLAALPILLAAAIRYTDTVVTACSFVCVTAIVFFLFKQNTFLARLIPFACMALSAGIYYVIHNYKKQKGLRFWADCLTVLEACCLLLFYISGNYFVVEDLGKRLFPGFAMPFSFVFWVFTAITPLAYVYFGLRNPDRLLLRIGLGMLAASVVTCKYYFSLGHHELTLTVAGTLLVALAYYGIWYLKHRPGRFTYAEDKSDETPGFENTEALIIAQTAGVPTAPDKGFDFGGGKFGGGGAGGNY